jgi:hypothetical protein
VVAIWVVRAAPRARSRSRAREAARSRSREAVTAAWIVARVSPSVESVPGGCREGRKPRWRASTEGRGRDVAEGPEADDVGSLGICQGAAGAHGVGLAGSRQAQGGDAGSQGSGGRAQARGQGWVPQAGGVRVRGEVRHGSEGAAAGSRGLLAAAAKGEEGAGERAVRARGRNREQEARVTCLRRGRGRRRRRLGREGGGGGAGGWDGGRRGEAGAGRRAAGAGGPGGGTRRGEDGRRGRGLRGATAAQGRQPWARWEAGAAALGGTGSRGGRRAGEEEAPAAGAGGWVVAGRLAERKKKENPKPSSVISCWKLNPCP